MPELDFIGFGEDDFMGLDGRKDFFMGSPRESVLCGGNEWGLREKDEAHTAKDIIATLGIIINTPPPWTGVYHERVE
jgi:hypothetical protein